MRLSAIAFLSAAFARLDNEAFLFTFRPHIGKGVDQEPTCTATSIKYEVGRLEIAQPDA